MSGLLQSIKGLRFGKDDPRGTVNRYYLLTLRHELEEFGVLRRGLFLNALTAEGILAVQMYILQLPCSARHL